MRKQKTILAAVALTLGMGSALATLAIEEQKLNNEATSACEQAAMQLPTGKTKAERAKTYKKEKATCTSYIKTHAFLK